MTVGEALLYARQVLKDVPDRDVDAAWIVGWVSGLSRSRLQLEKAMELTQQQQNTLCRILARRAKREPLQYIFGRLPFLNIELKTDSRALIPRDETAILTELALSIITQKKYQSMLDLCTGSGAIALACKYNLPYLSVCASDISADALSLAKENAQKLGLAVEWQESDLFARLESRTFDCILSNPPYIAQRDLEKLEKELSFEPQNALDGGADGLDFYREIIAQASRHLNSGGMLMFEMGAGQREVIEYLMIKAGFCDITVTNDYSGIERIIHCFKEDES